MRESLVFPYLAGAEFIRWWRGSALADTLPFGSRMPVSTEQILHPAPYARGDRPPRLAVPDEPDVLPADELGENEVRVLLAALAGRDDVGIVMPLGWDGDRYRVYRTGAGPALAWYSVWDDTVAAARFLRNAAGLRRTHRPGYRASFDRIELDSLPAVRYLLAPEAWTRRDSLPGPRIQPPENAAERRGPDAE